jgi:superoxide dismutase
MKTFHCDKCSQQVFFENTLCCNCGSILGYQPEKRVVSSFEPADDAPSVQATQDGQTPMRWRSLNPADKGAVYKQCHNYAVENVCNWMLPADDENELCASCQLTVIIPSLSTDKNHLLWQRLEAAKRRLLYSLWSLKLKPVTRQQDPEHGLAFQFLEDEGAGKRVLTGHDNGLITLNIAALASLSLTPDHIQHSSQSSTKIFHQKSKMAAPILNQYVINPPTGAMGKAFGTERKKHSLPRLPYDYNALEPHINAETLKVHHERIHGHYVDRLNETEEQIQRSYEKGDTTEMVKLTQEDFRLNAGGHVNHCLFFENLAEAKSDKTKEPQRDSDLGKLIERDFGSFNNFREIMQRTLLNIPGSGWGWLSYSPRMERLVVEHTENEMPLINNIPLLAIDVWEHAFFLQYKNDRKDYINNICRVINWDTVQKRLQRAKNEKSRKLF